MTQTKTVKWFKNHHGAKDVKVYQNLKFFLVPSLKYEGINPTHKILVWGIKKRRYSKHKSRNYEKVAVIFKNYFPVYVLAIYISMGLLLFLKLL